MFRITIEQDLDEGQTEKVVVETSRIVQCWTDILPMFKQALLGLGFQFNVNETLDLVKEVEPNDEEV